MSTCPSLSRQLNWMRATKYWIQSRWRNDRLLDDLSQYLLPKIFKNLGVSLFRFILELVVFDNLVDILATTYTLLRYYHFAYVSTPPSTQSNSLSNHSENIQKKYYLWLTNFRASGTLVRVLITLGWHRFSMLFISRSNSKVLVVKYPTHTSTRNYFIHYLSS